MVYVKRGKSLKLYRVFCTFVLQSFKNPKNMDIQSGIYTNDIDDRAYARHVFYRVEFKDNKGNQYIADILTRSPVWYGYGRRGEDKKPIKVSGHDARPEDYADFYNAGEIIEGAFSPLVISRTREDHTDPMYTSVATLTVWSDTDSKFLHLTQETDAVMLYVWTRKNNIMHRLIFSGVLDTSQYTEPYSKKDRYFVELTFQEYGQLKRTRHKLIQGQTVQEHIRTLLNQRFDCCGYREDLPNEDVPLGFGVQGIRPDISLFEDDKGKRGDAWGVLNMLLKNFGFTLLQSNNVLERVGLTQIYIKKGEPFKNEPKLKEKSNDNTLTITEQAKEVEVCVKIAGVDKESKAFKHTGQGQSLMKYRHDLLPSGGYTHSDGTTTPTYYPAYSIDFVYQGGKYYIGKVHKKTQGEHNEEFLALFYNFLDVTPLRAMYGGNYERMLAKTTAEIVTGYETRHALTEHRIDTYKNSWNVAPHRFDEKERVVYGTPERRDKFTTVSDGFILTNPIDLPNKKNIKNGQTNDTDPDFILSISLKLKVGLYTSIYNDLTKLELRSPNAKTDIFTLDSVRDQMQRVWENSGAYLYGAVIALDDDNKVVAYLKSSGYTFAEYEYVYNDHYWTEEVWDRNNTVKYTWEYVNGQTQLKTVLGYEKEEKDDLSAGRVIPNKYIKDYACGIPFGGTNGINYGRWESVSNPAYTPSNSEDSKDEVGTIYEDEGLHIPELPEEKNGRKPIKIIFVCFRKLVIGLKETRTFHATRGRIDSGLPSFAKVPNDYKDSYWGVRQYLGINMSYTDLVHGGVYDERAGRLGDYPFHITADMSGGGRIDMIFDVKDADKREILSPYYILVKDPEISIRDFQTVLNQGEEYKESKTTIKSIYSKGNTDAIKEELLYDDKMDIPLTSPSRVFAPHADAITPEAQGADFRFFSFSDLRAFDILTKKGVGLKNMEGTFDFNPFRHWGVFYHRGDKYIASREEIDLKAGKSIMTVHQLAQADPNTITKKIDKND